MAGMAATGVVEDFAVCHVACVLWQGPSGKRSWNCYDPERSEAQRCEQRQTRDVAFAEKLWNDLFLWLAECLVAAFAACTEFREGGFEACLVSYGLQLFMRSIGFAAYGFKALGI